MGGMRQPPGKTLPEQPGVVVSGAQTVVQQA